MAKQRVLEKPIAVFAVDDRKVYLERRLDKFLELQRFMGDERINRLSDVENAIKEVRKELEK